MTPATADTYYRAYIYDFLNRFFSLSPELGVAKPVPTLHIYYRKSRRTIPRDF